MTAPEYQRRPYSHMAPVHQDVTLMSEGLFIRFGVFKSHGMSWDPFGVYLFSYKFKDHFCVNCSFPLSLLATSKSRFTNPTYTTIHLTLLFTLPQSFPNYRNRHTLRSTPHLTFSITDFKSNFRNGHECHGGKSGAFPPKSSSQANCF